MALITNTKYDARQGDGFTTILVRTAAGNSADTTTVDLKPYGATQVVGILGFSENTAGSVVVTEAPTTSVTAGVLTITVGGSGNNGKVRNYVVYAK